MASVRPTGLFDVTALEMLKILSCKKSDFFFFPQKSVLPLTSVLPVFPVSGCMVIPKSCYIDHCISCSDVNLLLSKQNCPSPFKSCIYG